MAKINLKSQILRDLAGEPIYPNRVENGMLVEDKSKPALTIANLIVTNLIGEDAKATPEERFNNFRLASKIKDTEDEVELSIEELATIKKKVGENPMPLVVGRVWEALETLEKPKK